MMCVSVLQCLESMSGLVAVNKMKDELGRRLAILGPMLPTNSLDELIDGLGGPSKVSEVHAWNNSLWLIVVDQLLLSTK